MNYKEREIDRVLSFTYVLSLPAQSLKLRFSTASSPENHSSLDRGGLMYGLWASSPIIRIWRYSVGEPCPIHSLSFQSPESQSENDMLTTYSLLDPLPQPGGQSLEWLS